jgi:competence protein ComEA
MNRVTTTTAVLLALALPAIATAAPKHCYPKGAPEVSTCIGEKGIEACGAYVNLNTATAEELALLYRVGPVLAERIIAGRPYANPVDVDAVKGIGPATYEAMAPYIVTGEGLATTLAVDIVCENITDPAELEQINAG